MRQNKYFKALRPLVTVLSIKGLLDVAFLLCVLYLGGAGYRGTQRQFSENICSEDDLRFRIFGTFV